jgi:putative ABC transport system permease protein
VTAPDVALDRAVKPQPGVRGRLALTLAEGSGDGWRDLTLLYVATPELLANQGLELDSVLPDTELLTAETGELRLLGVAPPPGSKQYKPEPLPKHETISPTYTSPPGSFITLDALRRRGWEAAPSGRWLVETSRPLTAGQLTTARDTAAAAGLTIESRHHQQGLAELRSGATAVGVLLALAVLAMTVGLIRSEAANDLRTLTATGATSTTRRALTAATAGALSVLGVTLGTTGALTILTAGYFSDLSTLSRVPILHLVVLAIGTPTAAALAGWLLAGREPPALARQPID